MSYILDALRKSENERRQGDTPGITATRQHVGGSKRGIWLPVVGAILLINAVLMAFLLLRPSGDDGTRVAVALPPEAANPPPMAASARPAPQVRPLSGEVAQKAPDEDAVEQAPATPPAASPPAAPAVSASTVSPALPIADEPAAAESVALPSLQQLVLNGDLEIPPLRMDMHVYSAEASQRFVFINMVKYREGERLKEGPQVESIDSAGVILSHQGRRFTLARE